MSFILPSIGGGIIASPTAPAPAVLSNTRSIDFDGTNDYMDCGNVNDLDSATAFSMSLWVLFETGEISGKQCFISSGGDVNNHLRLHKGSSNEVRFQVVNAGSGSDISGLTSVVLSENTWHHVAVTYSSGTCKIYIDASLRNTGTTGSASSTNGDDFSIGRLAPFNTHYFGGLMDEVAIWNATLSDADITAIYNSGVPTDLSLASSYDTDRTSNLTHWWRMEEGSGTSVVNTANSGTNDGTLTNGPTFSTTVPTFNAYSVLLDGSNDYVDCGAITALNSATDFSVSMWVNFQSFVNNVAGYNIIGGSGSTTNNRFLLNVVRSSSTSANSLEVYFCEATASIVGTSGLTTNTWYHMAVYKSGSNMSFYIDNTLIDSRTNAPTSTSATGSNFAIGRGIYGGSYSSNILVDEVAVWDSDQSSNKDSIYNSGTPNDISSLSPVHWWRMGDNDGGTGTTITDQGSGGNDGTLTNGPTFSTTVP